MDFEKMLSWQDQVTPDESGEHRDRTCQGIPEPDFDLPPIRLEYGDNVFMDENFQLVNGVAGAAIWVPRAHSFRGLRGVCMFKQAANQCWQSNPTGNGRLTFWNQNSLATTPPEDWELFNFEQVSGSPRFRIRAIYGRYITWQAGGFRCQGAWASASVFSPR